MASRRSTAHRLSLVVAAALSLTVGTTQVAAGAGCTATWTVQAAPGLPDGAEVTAIAGLSASEAWAVGTDGTSGLLAHSTGGSWTSSRYSVAGKAVSLASIDAGPEGAWVVGSVAGATAAPLVLVNTGAGWRRVPVPSAAAGATLRSVSYRTGDDVWLSGSQAGHPVALRWDGARLRLLPLPFPGFAAAVEAPLTGVLILSGQSGRSGHPPQAWRRTGSTWVQDRMPAAPAASEAALLNIDSARGEIWAAGWGRTPGGAVSFVYRWTGTRWAPNSPPAGNAALGDVLVGRADGHVVAVGQELCDPAACTAPPRAVIWDWNGTTWQQVTISGLDPAQASSVTNVDGDGQGNRWASGSQGGRPLVLQQCTA
jgi:hypothetical protein